ncbi:MAG: response regulator transcription factor [Alphaproteobacteria bacterium]|nr:response regulator transcription factor [Alphaproteobacteria bacterium]
MATVLLVEDDQALGAQIEGHLAGLGLDVLRWRMGHSIDPDMPPPVDLVVLDLMLPNLSGFEVLEQLRKGSDVPVLVLSARDGSEDKVRALRLGADDYLTKPFWPEELTERVKARLRRPVLQRQDRVQLGALAVDLERREVWVDDTSVALTPVEFEILAALARRPGAAVTRRWLVANVLDPEREGNERTLDVHVSRLRRKLGPGMVETVWGVGYRLAGDRIRES